MPAESADELVFQAYKLGEELHTVKALRKIDKYEQYLAMYGKLLHPNNLCLVRIKYTLVGFYGRMNGFKAQDLVAKPALLERKLQLAKEVLEVLNIVEPGISSSKGVLHYEMHMPYFLKSQLNLSLGLITAQEAKKGFEQSVKSLEESLHHLQFNSQGSFGHSLFVGAKDTLKQLKQHVKNLKV